MVNGILKAPRDFKKVKDVDEEGKKVVQFTTGTLSPRSLKNRKFEKLKKLEEVKPVNYKLSYCTLRLNDNAANEEYLDCQRQEVKINAKYMLIAHAIIIGILVLLIYAFFDAKDGT